jgi:parallel beta-helix repeat protein
MIIKHKSVLICIVLCLIFNYSVVSSFKIQNSNVNPVNFYSLKNSLVWNLDPIIIDDSGAGDYTWNEAVLEAWCSGLGIVDNPYIIENLIIDGKDVASCLEIRNSTAHVKIINCTLFNAGYFAAMYYASIKLVNVSNVQLIRNDCSNNNGYGVVIEDSNHINLSENHVEENGRGEIFTYDGIVFINTNNSNIIENTLNLNGENGISFKNCKNIFFVENTVLQSGSYGIRKDSCSNITIYNNIIRSNNYGIGVYYSELNNISKNTIEHNTNGLYCEESDFNSIKENAIKYSVWGIDLYKSDYNNVTGNILVNNEYCINEDLCIGNIIEDNQCLTVENGITGYNLTLLIFLISLTSFFLVFLSKKKK